MPPTRRVALLGPLTLVVACLLTSCGSGGAPTAAQKKAVRNALDTTTTAPPSTTSTAVTAPTTTQAQVAVPNVIGLKIAPARASLRVAGLPFLSLNTPCTKGTLASESVVAWLAIPGKAPDVRAGAVPLDPGAVVPTGTRVGITWSGCFGDAATVPAVTGLPFATARKALHAVGLTWACYSSGAETTTTTGTPSTTATTAKPTPTVLTQSPVAGTVVHPGTTVSLTMHRCPQ